YYNIPQKTHSLHTKSVQRSPNIVFTITDHYFLYPIILAGTPATIANGGMDFVTTAPAATTQPWLNVIPSSIVTFAAIQTSSSIKIPILFIPCSFIIISWEINL